VRKVVLHILFFLSLTVFAQNTETALNLQWQFHQKGKDTWFPAKVPGNVHSDLLAANQIPDPFYGENEKKVQWVENENWEYKTEFTCDKKTFTQKHIELEFEGLDTYAKVYLNEILILDADNMFRSWNVDVKKNIKEGTNTLRIVFESAVKKGKAEAAKLPYTLPGDEKIFTRKAQYQYGWDFAPRFVTCGIWKPIKLITWNQLKVESVYAYTKEIKDSSAKVDFVFEINTAEEGYYEIRYNISTTGKDRGQIRTQTQLVELKPGISTKTITTTIPNAKLWWCNGMNKNRSDMYVTGFKITHGDTMLTQGNVHFGIRTLELIQDKDSIGSSFYFKLNGVPVFMKGANYIPQNSFYPNGEKNNGRKLLMMTKEAKINMLRIWGGGVYADEEFYRDCDRAGILVWQDFMFACAMYPSDEKFIENVKQEVIEQVKNLRNHPCLALWCGNNESDEGWKNWGWQKQYKYSKSDSAKIWNWYKNLFYDIIPSAVKQNDFKTPYWPSSPSIGWGHKESLKQGDSHYWGIWWGKEPFENYEKKVGRFMSEYGFQSLPDLKTFQSFCNASSLDLNSNEVKNHQKHPIGYETIKEYMKRDFNVPKDFEKFIYVSQLLQAYGMKTAIEAHRRAKPYCMGTLFWQLNDCWPGTTWSATGFNNTPKAFYYDLSRLYDNVMVSVAKKNNNYKVYIVNDYADSLPGKLTVSIQDFEGKGFYTKTVDVIAEPNTSKVYFTLSEKELPKAEKSKIYLRCFFADIYGNIKRKSLYYFTAPKNLALPKAQPVINFNPSENSLSIKSPVLIKNLFLTGKDIYFQQNFFDLEPNEEIKIDVKPLLKDASGIKFLSLYDINQ